MKLLVLLNGEEAGIAEQQSDGRLSFTYHNLWRQRSDAYPLSLSMPLARSQYPDSIVRPFLEGLLPDNAGVLDRWAREFHVSPRNPFALLAHMGKDCAGAVQLVAPERLRELQPGGSGAISWLSETEVAERLRDAVRRHGTGRLAEDRGRFSLAGAQPKTALAFDGARWGIPSGAVPTTHILKPPAQAGLDGFALNEHFCLKLARQLGLEAAESVIGEFDGERAIVLTRYDRLPAEIGRVVRLHQEDMCQALAAPSSAKYENEGGPGAPQIVDLLARESSDPGADIGTFIDALALNWAIAGTDAHAKNYSVLLLPDGVRLAPLYDLLSALPYPAQFPPRKRKLAMRIDREYEMWKIGRRHWEGLAVRCDLDAEPVVRRVREVLEALPEAAVETATDLRAEGIEHDILDRLKDGIVEHSGECARRLGER